MRRSARELLVALGLVGLGLVLGGGCASGSRVAPPPEVAEAPAPDTWADVETIDLSGREVTPPARSRAVEHDVPRSLLESRADDGIVEQVPGYRVQVFSSIDRNEALIMLDSVEEWLKGLSEEKRVELGLPADEDQEVARTVFASPYYRVRVGDYRTREEATALRQAMERRFPRLLVVPDQVRVTRD